MNRLLHLPRSQLVGAGSLVTSVIVHLAVVGAGAFAISASVGSPAVSKAQAGDEIEVDLGTTTAGSGRVLFEAQSSFERISPPIVVEPGGGEGFARPDTGHAGRGGSRSAASTALNLADRDDGLTLSREVTSRIDRDQIQRLHTAQSRASQEDRRSLDDPMDLVFYATGVGHRQEARPRAKTDPNLGALRAPDLGVAGLAAGPSRLDGLASTAERRDAGGQITSPGVGVTRANPGSDHRPAAAVANARPRVTKGPDAFAAGDKGAPQNDVDSEQEVAAIVQSLIHASTAGGLIGTGPGGEEGPDVPGSGGAAGPGSRAKPFGGGPGPFSALRDDDPRALAYHRSVLAKIWPLWEHAFPKWASLEGEQGRAIISFVIYATGQVDQVRITRPSGVPEFDENVRRAVLAAAPFDPFPPEITKSSMRKSITFDMQNPVVR
jgi:TonB family protein